MQVLLHRSGIGAGIGADQLTLIITLPNGCEFVAHAPRDELKDIADEAFDEVKPGAGPFALHFSPLVQQAKRLHC